MTFRPLRDYVLVQPDPRVVNVQTAGGLFLPDASDGDPSHEHRESTVIAVGPGTRRDDGGRNTMDARVGERVLLGSWTGHDIRLDGTVYVVVHEDQLIGVLLNSTPPLAPAPDVEPAAA